MKTILVLMLIVGTAFAGNGISNVERVIFAEAAAECSNEERALVADVIYNRVNHEGFKFKTKDEVTSRKCTTANQVVISKGEFASFLSKKNKNWDLTETNESIDSMIKTQKAAWANAKELSKTIKLKLCNPNKYKKKAGSKIYFFLSKNKSGKVNSTSEKRLLANRFWNIERAIETEHFVFYSINEQEETNK